MADRLFSAHGGSLSDLGTGNRNALNTLWNTTAQAGDRIVFDGPYNFAGSVTGPVGKQITFVGLGADSGFAIKDPLNTSRSLTVRSNGTRFENLNLITDDGWNAGKVILQIEDADDCVLRYCKMKQNTAGLSFLRADRPKVEYCFFTNPEGYATRWGQDDPCAFISFGSHNDDTHLYRNDFYQSHGELIKSWAGMTGGRGMIRPVIEECYAWFCGREFIDSTGGFSGDSWDAPAKIIGCVTNVQLFDAKCVLLPDNGGKTEIATRYVLIENCDWTSRNGIFCTMMVENGAAYSATPGAPEFWEKFMHNIKVQNCIHDGNAGFGRPRLFLIRTGHNMTFQNVTFYGESTNRNTVWNSSDVGVVGLVGQAVADAYFAKEPKITDLGGNTYAGPTRGLTWEDVEPSWAYGPQDTTTPQPSTDPLYVRSGSSVRINTDHADAVGAHMLSVSVANAGGRVRRAATVTVNAD